MYPNVENMIIVPNHNRNGDYYENQVYLIPPINFNNKENGGKKDFLAKTKHQYHVSQWDEDDCNAQKEWRLLRVSKFVPFHDKL